MPLYITGNSKGLICLWSYGQMSDKSLNQWILDKSTKIDQVNPKKATIKKLEFSQQGNKFTALNTGGQFYMMAFDLYAHSKTDPLFSTNMHSKISDYRLSDVSIIDRDSIVAGVSIKDKCVNIYDTLVPPRYSLVMQNKNTQGGNLLAVATGTNKLYACNGKPGMIAEFDLRMDCQQVSSKSLGKEEITAITMSPSEQSLVLGLNDGVVKIFDVTRQTMEETQSISAFTNVNGKKGAVTKVKFHPMNRCLFASTALGCIKLLRVGV